MTFLFVYISEAHASDVWPINQMEEDVESHKCEEDRMKAAVKFSETYRDFAER